MEKFVSGRIARGLAFAVVAAALAGGAVAQDRWPSRPLRLISTSVAGGNIDVMCRIIAEKLSLRLGQPVVVDNRPGAATVLGTAEAAKAPPDGYTFLVTYEGSQAINQSLYAKIPYDSIRDFQPVATLAVTPFFLIAGPRTPARSLNELIAIARAKPDTINYASSGSGSINHLLAEMLKTEAGIEMTHVPYKAIAAAMTDVMGGQVDVAFASVPSVIQLVRAGRLRALAVSSARRNASAPDVPTIAESGYPAFDVNPWWGILAPAGTPRDIVDKVNADVAAVLKDPEVLSTFAKQGAEAFVTTPKQFEEMLEGNVRKWAKVVKSSGARVD